MFVCVFALMVLSGCTVCAGSSVHVCICLYLLVFVSVFADDTVGHQGVIALSVRKQLI